MINCSDQRTTPDTAGRFLTAIFADAPRDDLRLAIFVTPSRTWRRFADLEDGAAYAMACSDSGLNAYFGLGLVRGNPSGRGKASDMGSIGALWADIDIAHPVHKNSQLPASVDEAMEIVKRMPLPPTVTVHSGYGLHVYWLLAEPWIFESPAEQRRASALVRAWHGLVCQIAAHRGWALENLGELGRVLRVPGTRNHKIPNSPAEVSILEWNESRRYHPDDFEQFTTTNVEVEPTGDPGILLRLDSTANPPLGVFGKTMVESPRFAETWQRRRQDLADQSPSGYDLSLATLAAIQGWSDQQIADLLIAFRREHGEKSEKALRLDYMSRTILRARQAADTRPTEEDDVDLSGILQAKAAGSAAEVSWPEPLSVPDSLPGVQPFDAHLLPHSLRPWITDIAERMQCPIDFPAVGAMVALAGVVGRKVGIRPKRHDDWLVVPNLWGALIGRPSVMKSPPLKEVMRPLKMLIDTAYEAYRREVKGYQQEQDEVRLRKSAIESCIKAAMKRDEDCENRLEEMRQLSEETDRPKPTRQRYVVNDSTVEALGELLAENPNGLVVTRDELVGLLKSLEREGQEPARAFYLEGWDGTGSFETDRISRGNLRIPSVCLSLIGTIQPGPLGEYLQEAIRGGRGDDGLMQRFQLAVWPDDPNEWVNVDRLPDSVSRNNAFKTFMILDELNPDAAGAQSDALRGDGIPFLRFDDAAQEKFFIWLTQHQNALLQGEEHPAVESHLAKYRSLIPSLALLIHLAEDRVGPVPLAAVERAIGWAQYLESHARRIYSQGIDGAATGGRALAGKILSGKLADGFVLRDVYRPGWSRLTGKVEALNAANYLIDLDWLSPVTIATGGAPRTIYRINPRIRESTFKPWVNRPAPSPSERTLPPFVSCVSGPEAM